MSGQMIKKSASFKDTQLTKVENKENRTLI